VYFQQLAADLQSKRDILMDALEVADLRPIRPEGTYFITADIRHRWPHGDAMDFCRALPTACGVVAIPGSVLYDTRHAHEGTHMVRFAFCKQTSTMQSAAKKLREWV
jgi:N-succinyldiaminopimelate aminotransferase